MTPKNMRPVFAVFEGLDGAGKSDISKIVAEKSGCEWMTTPSEVFTPVREIADRQYRDCGLAAQLFYASTVVDASARVKAALESGKSVIMDRYVASTLAYDKSVRESGISDSFWTEKIFGNVVVPDITFYFEAAAEVRRLRMSGRGQHDGTDESSIQKSEILHARYCDVFAGMRKKSWDIVHILNEGAKEECVEKCLLEIIKKQRT